MTGRAGLAGGLVVVEPRCLPIHKSRGDMTAFTGVGRRQVVVRLAGRCHVVVAAKASIYDVAMLELGACPTGEVGHVMTIRTDIGRLDVRGRLAIRWRALPGVA